jgi:hypothetical protein
MTPDELIDARIAEITEPLPGGGSPLRLVRELSSTPARAAALTAWAFAWLLLGLSLGRTSATAVHGTVTIAGRCGLDVYLVPSRDSLFTAACRRSETARLALFAPALVALLVGAGAGIAVLGRSRGSRLAAAIVRAPRQAAMVAVGLVALPLATVALHPVVVPSVDTGGVGTVSCGADSYFFGFPQTDVQHACSHVYRGHVPLLVAAALGLLIGIAGAAWLAWTSLASSPRGRRRLERIAMACAVVVVLAVALRPAQVRIVEGSEVVYARCGVDSVLAGVPDRSVQEACRSRMAVPAFAGAAAVLILGALGGLAAVRPRRGLRRALH